MDLCLIVPPANVEKYTPTFPGRFCIASVAFRNKRYADYFKKAVEEGHRVIMDQGVYEGDVLNDEDYLYIIGYVKPTVIVCPDIMDSDWTDNYVRSSKFQQWCQKRLCDAQPELEYAPQYMFVPQCNHVLDNLILPQDCSSFFDWIGICFNFCRSSLGWKAYPKDEERMRYAWTVKYAEELRLLKSRDMYKLHFLGIGDSFYYLRYYDMVDSMDTACVYWQGLPETFKKRPKDYFDRTDEPLPNVLEGLTNRALKCAEEATQRGIDGNTTMA